MKRTTLLAAVLGFGLLSLATAPAAAQGSLTRALEDVVINRVFKEELGRLPTDRELRRYRDRMYEEHWGEADIRDDLRDRPDYDRHSQQRVADPDRIVRRAYEDILHREPDAAGLRLYRSRILDDDWSEQDVRDALRKSPEHATRGSESADRIVKRAYQDILNREPDYSGLVSYRNKILNQGWDEQDVRDALRKSPEARQKTAITRSEAEQIVRRAYQSVLGRAPDAGSAGYVDRVMRDHWNEADVARELRNSDEYRNRH